MWPGGALVGRWGVGALGLDQPSAMFAIPASLGGTQDTSTAPGQIGIWIVHCAVRST